MSMIPWPTPRRCATSSAGDDALNDADAVILAVPHDAYLTRGWDWIAGLLAADDGLVVDVRARLARDGQPAGIELWRL